MTDDDLKPLELALAVSLAREIIDADGVTDYAEFKLFGRIFPRALLREHGFVDEHGAFTPALDAARDRALQVLPTAMEHADKLDLLAILWGEGVADDDLDTREVEVLRKAAALLAVPFDDLLARVSELDR